MLDVYIFLSVPPPNVSISLSTDVEAVYQGTQLVLTCSISVHSAVNTDYNVDINWSKNRFQVISGQYVTISETEGSGHEYSRTVTFSPVDTSDSAIYNCTTSLSPSLTGSVIASSETTDTIVIAVKSKLEIVAEPFCEYYFLISIDTPCGGHGDSYSHCLPDILKRLQLFITS